jgi:hypothetical protein
MILEFDGFVGDAFVSEINRSVAPYLTEGKTNIAYNRDGYTVPVSQIEGLRDIDAKICSLFSEFQSNILQHRYRPQFSSADTGYEYHLYKPKDICHFHADGEVAGHFLRYATAILFLTDNDDGELVFPSQNIEIKPQKGKLVVFPPTGVFSHYSKPAKEERIILMTWFVYNGITVKDHAT